jgi:hypothetical protein
LTPGGRIFGSRLLYVEPEAGEGADPELHAREIASRNSATNPMRTRTESRHI